MTDPELKAQVTDRPLRQVPSGVPGAGAAPLDAAQERIASSSDYLREVMGRVPVLVIGAIDTGEEDFAPGNQAGLWGSLLAAAWSFALALRARGLGTSWTTLHLRYEREVRA
nr:nitroreductase family protein [Planosporangium mesophilum]